MKSPFIVSRHNWIYRSFQPLHCSLFINVSGGRSMPGGVCIYRHHRVARGFLLLTRVGETCQRGPARLLQARRGCCMHGQTPRLPLRRRKTATGKPWVLYARGKEKHLPPRPVRLQQQAVGAACTVKNHACQRGPLDCNRQTVGAVCTARTTFATEAFSTAIGKLWVLYTQGKEKHLTRRPARL